MTQKTRQKSQQSKELQAIKTHRKKAVNRMFSIHVIIHDKVCQNPVNRQFKDFFSLCVSFTTYDSCMTLSLDKSQI